VADVPDHLVPTDGLTNSYIRFDGLVVLHDQGAGARLFFGIYDESHNKLADFPIEVRNAGKGVQDVIAEGHRQMTDILRQWLHTTDVMRDAYESGPK
jgi:hypothetical protein